MSETLASPLPISRGAISLLTRTRPFDLIPTLSFPYSSTLLNALYVFCIVLAYGALLLLLGRPLLSRHLGRAARAGSETLQRSLLALTFMAIFLSAFVTVSARRKGQEGGQGQGIRSALLLWAGGGGG